MPRSIVSIAALVFMAVSLEAQIGEALFKIQGITTEPRGSILLGAFTKENFPELGKAFKSKDVVVTKGEMEILPDSIPEETYGAVVFKGEDDDKKLETNFVGFPKELIGFANEAKINFGPPDFEEAAITIIEGEIVVVNIQLK